MRSPWLALALPVFLAACASTPQSSSAESLGQTSQRFTSGGQAVLVDFQFDGTLRTNSSDEKSAEELTSLIRAQLKYTVGQLNGDRSVGRYERLEISIVEVNASTHDVMYHAKLPVAWGGSAVPPTAYAFRLPARIGQQDQVAFATKYASTCVDASFGDHVGAGDMFLAYRPLAAQCNLDPADVVTMPATITVAAENTVGKYPEYHRIWDDGALDIVAMFSQELPTNEQVNADAADGGVRAYNRFVVKASEYLRGLQPDNAKRTAAPTDFANGSAPGLAMRQVTLGAQLPDGRAIHVDVMLVRTRLDDDGVVFDQWYSALTPKADVILYNGHAGLGDNVRALMEKGTFQSGKYMMWIVNGCDTFAYVDRTLIDRRALLNKDDPSGTKYMDTISNVLAGYFDTTPQTSMAFIEAIVDSRQTYQQILATIDAEQLVVVTGEEDNEFQPPAAPIVPSVIPSDAPKNVSEPTATPQQQQAPQQQALTPQGCGVSSSDGRGRRGDVGSLCLVAIALAACSRRLRSRRSLTRSPCHRAPCTPSSS